MCKNTFTKKLLSILIVIFMIISASTPVVFAEALSGTCGNTITWTLDDNGVLTISGFGNMPNYNNSWLNAGRTITKVVIGNGITSIGNNAFENCSGLESVSLPDSLAIIGSNAFKGCIVLKGVSIPKGVKTIGSYTFYGCSGLTTVPLPQGLVSIGEKAFAACTNLKSISVPQGVVSIGNYAFDGCVNLSTVSLPQGLTGIGEYTFRNCSSLTGISVPSGVTSIGQEAFADCKSLATVSLPTGLTSIGNNAFKYCISLKRISIPAGVKSIGSSAFYGCVTLADVTILQGVESIGRSAFEACTSLKSVSISQGVVSIGDRAFFGCVSLSSVSLSQGLTSIGEYAFEGCVSLTKVAVPDGVTHIGWHAFYGCISLTDIYIPKSVTIIGYDAFGGCSSISNVLYSGSEADWEEKVNKNITNYSNNELTTATIRYNSAMPVFSTPTTNITTTPQQGECALYSADVSPKKGYSNRTDNDMSGTSFKYTVETSTDITDIFVLTETNWKITSNYFNYISKDEVNGKLKWTFELNINSPGSRAFNIVGVDASGRETSPAYVSFEVVARGSIYDDVSDDSSYVNEVKYLKENNIITGKENNNFDPEGYLTRAEAATIICRIAGFNNLSGADSGFSDVPSSHWASGYVKKARDLGIISGIGNNMFDPEGILTGYQFVKMVVCQLGYNDVVQNQYGNDSYPNGFYYYAKDKLNLLKNIQNGDYSVPMNRSDASVLAYNAMHAPKYNPQSAVKNEVVGNGANSLSEAGRKFIKNQEGLRLNMYDDDHDYSNGWQNPTIGYGTLVDASVLSELGASEPSQSISITQAKAEELFERGVRYREEKFNNLLAKENVKLTQNQYDAIMSWMYNFSFERWNSSSHRLKRCVYEGVTDEVTVKEAFTTWCLKGSTPSLGLVERRLREANIYLYNNYGTSGTENGENTYYLGIKQYEIANPNAPESEYNPSIFFKSGASGNGGGNSISSNTNIANPVVYSQTDSRWGNYSFYHATNDKTGESWPTDIANGGCSVMALVNAVKFLTGKDVNPKALADFAIACGARTPGKADKVTLCREYVNMTEAQFNALAWPELASAGVKKLGGKTWAVNNSEVTTKADLGYNMLGKSLGINYQYVKFNIDTIKNHLKSGGVAIVSVKTSTGHVVSLAGYDESKGFLYLDSLKTSPYWKNSIQENNDDVVLLWK